MNKSTSTEVYQQNVYQFTELVRKQKTKRSYIAWLRLLIVVITIFVIQANWQAPVWALVAIAASGLILLLYAVSIDTDARNRITHLERLLAINREELNILNDDYLSRENGSCFIPRDHNYANDLDIFGDASLYQYLNRCTAEQSRELLAQNLLVPLPFEAIPLRQQAVKELSEKTAFRQEFQAIGQATPVTKATEKKIITWLQQPYLYERPLFQWIAWIYPVITLGVGLLYMIDVVSAAVVTFCVLLFWVISFLFSKKIRPVYLLLSRIVPEVTTLYNQLHLAEKESFKSEQLLQIKQQMRDKQPASVAIRQLKKILDRFDMQLNVFVFVFLNTFLLWDLQQLLGLNKWKKKNQSMVAHWFSAIADIEVLSSIGTLAFNQPGWTFPLITDQYFTFSATDLGHPLIPANKRIYNSFTFTGTGKIALVTGSNMGGKSTFLRSVGVNTVLALAGAPVCATALSISPTLLMSSMRVADNLAESTSTFYAELKKLESIITAVNRKEKIFVLLDEILRGTNSLDRHTGSKALIRQLIRKNAVGILATHDVELAALENEFAEALTNYHFDVQVENEELYFDYKLKAGICRSLNASILMKKIGIELT